MKTLKQNSINFDTKTNGMGEQFQMFLFSSTLFYGFSSWIPFKPPLYYLNRKIVGIILEYYKFTHLDNTKTERKIYKLTEKQDWIETVYFD